ncbi:MAG: MAPEG family protein [Deltaproteobacteria bacterium]
MRIPVPVTLLYAGLNALLITVLGIQVSRLRGATATGLGAPLPAELIRPVRAHANAIEWVPLGLVLLLALELSGAGTRFTLHLAGGTLLLARVLHAAGVYGKNKLSVAGAGLTYLVILAMAVWAIAARFVLFGP